MDSPGDDVELTLLVRVVQRRLRLADVLGGAAAGLVVLALTVTAARLVERSPAVALGAGTVLGLGLLAVAAGRAWPRWSEMSAAERIEAHASGMDNLVVTAMAMEGGRLAASDRMRAEILRQAAERAARVLPEAVAPVRPAALLVAAASVGALVTTWSALSRPEAAATVPAPATAASIAGVAVTVVPPAYLGRTPSEVQDPGQLSVIEGSTIRVVVQASAGAVWLVEPGEAPRPFAPATAGTFIAEWSPDTSRGLVIAAGQRSGDASDTRVIDLRVVPDVAPRVRVVAPGRDLATADSTRVVDVEIEATDGEQLSGLRLAYVKMSGSGESFAFAEGQIPVVIEQVSARDWRGRSRVVLGSLGMEEGDSLVYRALVRDSNPRGEWVESEAYTIDVGKRLEFASAGAAVPDEDRRYALSQQMVIVKTEQLQAERRQVSADAWTERTRLLAMEQRMVRAEVVFLSGGEVEDEVEEAAQSNELQEGRLQNAARAEMLRAINEMSKAEARLNASDTSGALVFERSALAALQRAFDRRRYFLRTLGERSRIDPSRRLTGDSSRAQSSGRAARRDAAPELERARQLMQDLAAIGETGAPPDAAVLGRLATVDPASADWRELAARLAAALTPEARRAVADGAMTRLAAWARGRAGATAPVAPGSVLRGWWRDEWPGGGRP